MMELFQQIMFQLDQTNRPSCIFPTKFQGSNSPLLMDFNVPLISFMLLISQLYPLVNLNPRKNSMSPTSPTFQP